MNNLNELDLAINELKRVIIKSTTTRDNLLIEKKSIDSNIESIDLDKIERAIVLLQAMSEGQRLSACNKLAELGTYALQYSLGDNYEMVVELSELRKKPNANIYIKKLDTGFQTDPVESNGGGVVDITSIALRLVILQSQFPVIDGPIIFDEPFKMVSKEYIPQLSQFIKNIFDDFGRQVIIITHNEYLASMADKVMRVYLENGESKIEVENGNR